MSAEDLEALEADLRLSLYREYRDVSGMFRYVVETERGIYLANEVEHRVETAGEQAYLVIELRDAWVWDLYRQRRFSPSVTLLAFEGVSIEELTEEDLRPPEAGATP